MGVIMERLSKADKEVIIMAHDITGVEPEIILGEKAYQLRILHTDKTTEEELAALKDAVRAKLGERITFEDEEIIVRYEQNNIAPKQKDTHVHIYCRKLRQVLAAEVSRENEEELQALVNDTGTWEDDTFVFITPNGTFFKIKTGEILVTENRHIFERYTKKAFFADYEIK